MKLNVCSLSHYSWGALKPGIYFSVNARVPYNITVRQQAAKAEAQSDS